VRSYELDPYNHLNHGVYVNWFEDARERFLRLEGRTWNWYPENEDLWFVVVNVDCDFVFPAVGGDELTLRTRLGKLGNRSLSFRQSLIRGDGQVLGRAKVTMCFTKNGKAKALSKDFLSHFHVSPEGDQWSEDEGGDRG